MRLFELIAFIACLSPAVMGRTQDLSDHLPFTTDCNNPAFKAHETLSTPRGTCPASFYPILLQMTKCAFFLSSRRDEDIPAYPSNGIPSLQPDPSDACDFWNVYLAAFPDLGEKTKEDPLFRHKFARLKYTDANGKLRDYNCEGNRFISTYPGVADVPNLYPAFNDRIISFKCTTI